MLPAIGVAARCGVVDLLLTTRHYTRPMTTCQDSRQKDSWHGMAYSRTLARMARRDDALKAHVGQLVLQLRKDRGWTQAEAARQAGVSDRLWQRWEGAESFPRLDSRRRLAETFAIDPAEFFPPAPDRTADLGELRREVSELRERVDALEDRHRRKPSKSQRLGSNLRPVKPKIKADGVRGAVPSPPAGSSHQGGSRRQGQGGSQGPPAS